MTTQSLHEESQSTNNDDSLHAPMLGKTSPMLSYFCVYNPSLGPTEENTKDQILYYTAKRVVPADVKMKQVGLAQALVNFTSAFSPSKPAQNVHTQKNRMVFLQPEPGFWMYMCVELGILRRQIRDPKGKEKLVTEYLDTQLSDRALESVLKIGYEQFKLLHGTFSYILYQDDEEITGLPSRQRTRSLMHCIEEFFSEWIWKWDFDRLDTMVFSAVFNGVPVQPILRTNYLKIHELDRAIHEKFNHAIDHVLVFDSDDGGLLYRSPSLNIRDVCALRKYVFKRIEKNIAREKEIKQRQTDRELTDSKKDKISGLKFFTKSISQSHFLGFFTSSLSTKTVAPVTSAPVSPIGSQESLPDLLATETTPETAPDASPDASPDTDPDANPDTIDLNPKDGKYLTGLVQSTSIDMNGDERTVTRIEMAQVYLSSRSALDTSPDKPLNNVYGPSRDGEDEILTEYYLVIYKHKTNIVWSFLLPSFSQEAEDLLADQKFYSMLEKYMIEEQNLNSITEAIISNVRSAQEKSNSLGKHYKCFYYDNATLNMKSTMVNQQGRIISKYQNDGKFVGGIPMNNDMLLQLLDLKEDFERLPRTTEIYTRSISNYWIAGHRLYNTVLTKAKPVDKTINPTEEAEDAPKIPETPSTLETSEAPEAENTNDKTIEENPEDKGFAEYFARPSIDSLRNKSIEDYTEIYLVAAKKDTSLADVEETLNKMTTLLVDAMHLE